MKTFHVTLRYNIPDELIEQYKGAFADMDALAHVMDECDDDGVVDIEEVDEETPAE